MKNLRSTALLLLTVLQVSCIGIDAPLQVLRSAVNSVHLPESASPELLDDWQLLLSSELASTEPHKLAQVNAFFNRLRFVEDRNQWHAEDYWATPRELLSRSAGDCEDLVIGKYFTLRELQVPDERLRITYVIAGQPTRAHMVLAYYSGPETEPLILDSLTAEIRGASSRPDLAPVFGFNGQSLWVAGTLQTSVEDPASRLAQWRGMLARMRQESALTSI